MERRTPTVALAALVLALAAAVAVACSGEGEEEEASPSPAAPTGDIVATAETAGDFTTLVDALSRAGLVETLRGEGPFTVFAPNDAAFAALPEGTLDELLADPKGQLKDVLLYHIVPGEKLMAADLAAGGKWETALPDESLVAYTGRDGKLYVNDVEVVTTDVECTNGVVHVIGAVLRP